MICYDMPWYAMLSHDMLHKAMLSMLSYDMPYVYICYDIVTSWGMFTNIKPYGKNIQVRCRTNLPLGGGYMF